MPKEICAFDDNFYKPFLKSVSPDALFVYTIEEGKNLFIGLAVKRFKSASFGMSHINEEVKNFNNFFDQSMGNHKKVSIICATNFNEELVGSFEGKNFFLFKDKKLKFINEVIVLNLSGNNLAEFMGFQPDDLLANTLKMLIDKIEPKYERFFPFLN